MAYPVITGAVLIEALGAALNMAGQDEGGRTGNVIMVKQLRIGRNRYPYVSGQAWRRWWREVLYADFGWEPSPVTREQKSAYTEGDPIVYAEDDIFGYMAARKRSKKKNSSEQSGTFRRVSPLKNSLLISVLPNVITDDFGHFSRNLKEGEDYILFEHQHYTAPLQGVFTISLTDVGRFEVGEMKDIPEEKVEAYKERLRELSPNIYTLPPEEKVKRVKDVLGALARLRHGAQLARHLTDVSPVVIILGFLDGGNAPFQNLFSTPEGETVILDLKRFESVLNDYAENLLKVEGKGIPVFIGLRPSILANEEEIKEFAENNKLVELCGTPKQALLKAMEYVEKIYNILD
ncbi:type I-B CRISPR-associated protein Cas7/Cst2/DevR [Thermosulfurimonas sp. F29]|uniref:type I-B CRISPR-associated protein Cas7/Cst2/DevR n=1 Tax=Thermosulfurimonas sp. F29 TaxID=2867247 RepID=UPI001C82C005|nr:type I-B CRISPR-associated protein Cas7/Cst2/DevR [Thermosulfurimonas sp. F29]MBX6423906.1 type I-B CRISPR-associated protein Cas7/Cst2/DevR [Thermosulfurimonas sp. F29]